MVRWVVPMIGAVVVAAGIGYSFGNNIDRPPPVTPFAVAPTADHADAFLTAAAPRPAPGYYLYHCLNDTLEGVLDLESALSCLEEDGMTGEAVVAEGGPFSVAVFGLTVNFPQSFYIAWAEDDELWLTQEITNGAHPIGERLLPSLQSADEAPSPIARVEIRDGRMYVALFVDGPSGSTSPHMRPVLLAYEHKKWRVRWFGGQDEMALINARRIVRFDGDGIDQLVVEGDVIAEDPFGEPNAGPHRFLTQVWQLRGEEYVLASMTARASAYNTLVEFVLAMKDGDSARASLLVSDGAVIDAAISLGLVDPARRWSAGGISDDPWDDGTFADELYESVGDCDTPRPIIAVEFVDRDGVPVIASLQGRPPATVCQE